MTQAQALAQLEQRLQTELSATGITYAEKVRSLQSRLPAPLFVQLLELPNLQGEAFSQKLSSSHKQLGFFATRKDTPQPQEIWDEKKRAEVRANISANPPSTNQKPSLSERLHWWLYQSKRDIPKRANATSRVWRLPMTVFFGASGAFLGWSLWGYGGALLSFLIWAGIGFWAYGEDNLARAMWSQVRLLETLLRLLRGAFFLLLGLLGLGLVTGLFWLVLRFWGSR